MRYPLDADEGHVIPDWYDSARCKRIGPEAFYGMATAYAVSVCGECPVREQCREFALAGPLYTQFGVWGGLTEEQRLRIRKGRIHNQQLLPHRPGTAGSYAQHRRLHEPTCQPCRDAHNAANRARQEPTR